MGLISSDSQAEKFESAGIVVFILFCGLPALELNGFGFGIPLTLPTALLIATFGGVVGGMLVCRRPAVAGFLGGLLAGPLGLLGLNFYVSFRSSIYTLELVLIQGLASLPGILVGVLIYFLLTRHETAIPTEDPNDTDDPVPS